MKAKTHSNGNNGTKEAQRMKDINLGPTFDIIAKNAVPARPIRGREAFIKQLPFWPLLVEKLQNGLDPFEAVDIELKPCQDPDGNHVDAKQMVARIRYQFQQLNLSKKFSLIVNENNHLYVVDHETRGQVTA